IHARVVGTAADGRAYRADDPHLLGWVHLTLTDSMWWAYERFHDRVDSPADADAYFAETARVGAALGVADPARTAGAAADQLAGYLPELARDEITERTLHFLRHPPLPGLTGVGYRPLAAAAWWGLPDAAKPLAGPGPCVPFPEQAARAELAGLRLALGRSPALTNARARAGAGTTG
ncbi:MAG: oxygenase MpaB family protein, partial [Acidimicrobiia bacterium]